MAAEVNPGLFARGAVGKGDVVIGNVVEEVNFFLLQEQACGDGVNRRISPSFVEETAILIEGLEEIDVGLGPEPVEVTDFEVGPL